MGGCGLGLFVPFTLVSDVFVMGLFGLFYLTWVVGFGVNVWVVPFGLGVRFFVGFADVVGFCEVVFGGWVFCLKLLGA